MWIRKKGSRVLVGDATLSHLPWLSSGAKRVHDRADGYHIDPAGDSGARVACGVSRPGAGTEVEDRHAESS